MKLHKLLPLLGVATILTGCTLVGETYNAGEFHTQDFTLNYYRNMPARFLSGDYVEEIYDLIGKVDLSEPHHNAFAQVMEGDIASGDNDINFEKTVELYGNKTAKEIKKEDYLDKDGNVTADYNLAVIEQLADPSNVFASWTNYARYNNLAVSAGNDKVKSSFKKGYFSKLTDGLLRCDGTGSLVRMQIEESGMGQVFDHELISYRNFILSARGGTSVDYSKIPGVSTVKSAKVEFNISFYIEKSMTPNSKGKKITLNYTIDQLQTDDSGTTSVMSFDLSKINPENPELFKRVSGMSIDYKLLSHDYLMPGGVKDEAAEGEFALMLYEVMLPFASWY